jgi:hypothetical protein
MSRRHTFGALIAAFAAVTGVLLWLNWPHDDPSKVVVEDAVRAFREQGPRNAGLHGGNRPVPGVYRYATRGSESVAADILSTTHAYDGISTITVSSGSCGDIERWEVLRERWTETEWCGAPGGTEAWKVTEFHEFFGTEKKDTFKCQGESIRQPPFENGSTRFRNRCESSGSSALGTARLQGFVTIEVNGEEYEAAHIFSQSVVEGDTTGTTETEDWRRRSDGLLLRRQVSSDALTNAGGGARYIESYRIKLIDPHPQR